MTPYYESPEGQIFHGDVLTVLKQMPDESVQMCVTSPPYWGLRDYGNDAQIWDDCDFGILCNRCNLLLPTKDRKEWLKNVTRYINK